MFIKFSYSKYIIQFSHDIVAFRFWESCFGLNSRECYCDFFCLLYDCIFDRLHCDTFYLSNFIVLYFVSSLSLCDFNPENIVHSTTLFIAKVLFILWYCLCISVDYTRSIMDRRSITEYYNFLGEILVSWLINKV